MPKKNKKQNYGFELNPAMKMVTTAAGIPGYDSKNFTDKFKPMMEDLQGRVSDFARTTKVFGDIDRRSGEYSRIINDPEIGISGSAENNPVQRMFVKGSDKKYPYLYSRFNPNANPDYAAIFAGDQSNMRITDDKDFLQLDSKGGVETYQNVDQNTTRAQNYLKNLSIAGRAYTGKKDKESLSRAEADAKLSSQTFDKLTQAMRSGNIAAAESAINLANQQYNPGKNNLFQTKSRAFIGEEFMGPVGNTFSGQNLNQVIFNTGSRGKGYHAGQYMDRGYYDAVGQNKNIITASDGQVKFEHRRMLGGINTLHNIAKRFQTQKNQADKKSYDINKDYKYQFEKIGKKIKNLDTSLPKVGVNKFFGFDSKSGGFNIKLNIKDSKSNE